MVHKAITVFALLAAIFTVATPAMDEVRSTRSLLCKLHKNVCTEGCNTCVCGKCVKCGKGYHSSGHWDKDCVPDCKTCRDPLCADCGCDGYCNACVDGCDFNDDGYCEEIHYEEPVHYEEPIYYEKPAPKPVYVKKGKGGGGGGRATADATATGSNTSTKTNTDCGKYGCSSSSSSRSSGRRI